jgi:hypothetical protein
LLPTKLIEARQTLSVPATLGADDEVVAGSEVRRLEDRLRGLERLLDRKTLEVEILKEGLDLARANQADPSSDAPRQGRAALPVTSG